VKVKELNKREEIKNKDKIEGKGQHVRKKGREDDKTLVRPKKDLDNINETVRGKG
jgi:hypothetical protein